MKIKLFFTLLALPVFIWCLTAFNSYFFFNAGNSALERGEMLGAIVHFERAGLWYAPGFSVHNDSLVSLKKLSNPESRIEPELRKRAESALRRVQHQIFPWSSDPLVLKEMGKTPLFDPATRIICHMLLAGWILFSCLFFFKGFQSDGTVYPVRASIFFIASLSSFLFWLSTLMEI